MEGRHKTQRRPAVDETSVTAASNIVSTAPTHTASHTTAAATTSITTTSGAHAGGMTSNSSSAATSTTSAATATTSATTAVTTAAGVPHENLRQQQFRNLLDESAREAFNRPWHRLERGLRLNRLRMYVEEVSSQCSFTREEKEGFFQFLQRALDRKLLNTHKIVNYIPELQKIDQIRGLEVRRNPDGTARWGFVVRKAKTDATRKRRKIGEGDELTPASATSTPTAGAGAGMSTSTTA